MTTQYFFVSSYGREGPFADEYLAAGRAEALAVRAAADGRDRECPRVEGSDGTARHLSPFGALLHADDIKRLPRSFERPVNRDREEAEFVAQCADTLVERLTERSEEAPAVLKDKGAQAIYTWTLRRAILALLVRLPETRALARELEARWYAPE